MVVATHFIHFKCYDERRGGDSTAGGSGSGTCSPAARARAVVSPIVLATMKHCECRKQ